MKKSISTLFHTRILNRTVCLLFLLFVLSVAISCNRESKVSGPFRWPVVNAEADRLTQRIDSLCFLREEEGIMPAIDSLRRISKDINEEELSLRVLLFDAREAYYNNEEKEYQEKIDYLLSATDSSSHPYLYNRILDFAAENDKRDANEYQRISCQLEYFRDVEDPVLTASSLISMGNILKNVRDASQAINLYEEADSLLISNGFPQIALFNRMNIATANIILRDTLKAKGILHDMLKNPEISNRPDIKENVLHNLYIDCGERGALDTLYAMRGEESESLIETFMSNALLNDGDIKGAIVHADKAVEKALADENANDYAVALYAQADALSASGDTLKAYRSLNEAVELTDEIGTMNEPEKIKNEETDRLLSLRRLEDELAHSRWQLRMVVVAFIVFILLVSIAFILRNKIRRLREKHLEAKAEKDKIARKLVATQIAMDETHKVLSTVEKAVDGLVGNGNASERSREIANAIHTHKVKNGERERFIESFSEVHPDFAHRLREKNEAITEPDIRLASYIVTGLDNKQIATTMGIRPESVKQARWRLRTKLGLQKGASLEEALRELNRT